MPRRLGAASTLHGVPRSLRALLLISVVAPSLSAQQRRPVSLLREARGRLRQDPAAIEDDWASSGSTDSPYGWVRTSQPGSPSYYHVHIPKAAGVSFVRDMLDAIPANAGLYSWEACYAEFQGMIQNSANSSGPHRTVTMLRRPASHVYSQYLQCVDTLWGQEQMETSSKWRVTTANLSSWLQHFVRSSASEDFNCYHPLDMQTRALSCDWPQDPHHLGADDAGEAVQVATKNVDDAFFVGLVEYYQESLCLLHAKADESPLPAWCNCEDQQAWRSHTSAHADHYVRKHSLEDLDKEQIELIKRLTQRDELIYEHAERRLLRELRDLEKQRGTKVLCGGRHGKQM